MEYIDILQVLFDNSIDFSIVTKPDCFWVVLFDERGVGIAEEEFDTIESAIEWLGTEAENSFPQKLTGLLN